MPRWLRVLILFLMVLSLVIYISPLQVEASAVAATLVGAATVKVSADLVIPAIVIALGVAAGSNDDFVNMVSNAVSAAGDWVVDGTVELLQTVDTLGQKTYYAAGQIMEDLRTYLFTSNVVAEQVLSVSQSFTFEGESYNVAADFPIGLIAIWHQGTTSSSRGMVYAYNNGETSDPIMVNGESKTISLSANGYNFYFVAGSSGSTYYSRAPVTSVRTIKVASATPSNYRYAMASAIGTPHYTSHDLTLGTLPSQTSDLTDGSSARAWSETYTDNGLYVVGGSNDPDPPDENNGKWFWPIALALTAADLIAMSQSDQWSGITPGEFDNYEESQNYYITPVEVSFGQGIEISPVTNPDTGGDTGGDTGEDPETDPDTGGEVQTDYTTWFSRLYTSVENIAGKFDEIPNKFQTWITDCKTAIEAIPSKFADWFANLKTSVDTFASNAQDAWSQTVTSIQSLPASIADSLAGLMPDADPEPNPPSDLGNYTIDLKDFFPFCIPFDLYDFFTCLNADPVAPVIEWEIYLPGGEVYPLVLDLSVFDTVALLLRRLQLLLFCTGLAFKTRDLIRG